MELTQQHIFDRCMPEPNTGCWIWIGPVRNNYGLLHFNKKTISAHRTAYRLFNGDFDSKLDVCHSCDNPMCINPQHLFLGTHKQNMDDRDNKGRCQKGSKHYATSLTDIQVLAIRDACSCGFSNASIGRYFGVHRNVIFDIKNRFTWKHV